MASLFKHLLCHPFPVSSVIFSLNLNEIQLLLLGRKSIILLLLSKFGSSPIILP